jgi:putative PIN family toxin of toxin-antitoxin system
VIRSTWDTNALASGAVARHGVLAALISGWRRGDFEIVTSEHILSELERALDKPYFRSRLSASERAEFLGGLCDIGIVVDIATPIPTVLPDRADNMILATAKAGSTPYIVTGDRELLALGDFEGVRIVSAREYYELISKGSP